MRQVLVFTKEKSNSNHLCILLVKLPLTFFFLKCKMTSVLEKRQFLYIIVSYFFKEYIIMLPFQ